MNLQPRTGRGVFTRADWWIALSLGAAALALRVPFRSRLPYHWDSAEFAIAVRDYNVALSQPHAPGYFLYVMLGRLLDLVVGDPHASLVWLSVIFGSALTALLYLTGTGMFGRRAGVTAALISMTSPQAWFHSCVALTYVVDGFFVSLAVLVCWLAMRRGVTWRDAIWVGGLTGIVGGIRQQSVAGLIPVVLYALWSARDRRFHKIALAGMVSVGVALTWFVPMVAMSGGLGTYLEIVRRHTAFNAPATLSGGGGGALQWNIFFSALFCGNGLMLGTLVLIGALLYRVGWLSDERKRKWDLEHAIPMRLIWIWVLSMIILMTAVGFTKQPGYVLSYLPGLVLLVGAAAGSLRSSRFLAVVASVVAINVLSFLAWPDTLSRWTYGLARTAREIHQHDQKLAEAAGVIRANFHPGDVAICHAQSYLHFGLRQFQWVLPEFDQYQFYLDSTMVTPPGKPMLAVCNGHSVFAQTSEPFSREKLLLVVPPSENLNVFAQYIDVRLAAPVPFSCGMVYLLKSPQAGR